MPLDFRVHGFRAALLGALIVSVVSWLLNRLVRDAARASGAIAAAAALVALVLFRDGDTALFGVARHGVGARLLCADHVLFGTDFPFIRQHGPGFYRDTIAAMSGRRASAEDKAKIYEGNARRLLRLNLRGSPPPGGSAADRWLADELAYHRRRPVPRRARPA